MGITWLITATRECECSDMNSQSCQLHVELALHTFKYDTMRCKSNANQKCKAAIVGWAKAYENATNAKVCKNSDPKYNAIQNAAISCK